MAKNKGLFERESVLLDVDPQGQAIGNKYRLRNIRRTGFGLETDHRMAEGERFDLSFSLPESQDIIHLSGKVIWVKQVSANPENYYIGFAYLANLDKTPALFPLLLNQLEQAEFNQIHFSACYRS